MESNTARISLLLLAGLGLAACTPPEVTPANAFNRKGCAVPAGIAWKEAEPWSSG